MALLYALSCYGDPSTANRFEGVSVSGTAGQPTMSTTTAVRSGERAALRITGMTSGLRHGIGHRPLSTNAVNGRDYWHTFGLYVVQRPSADNVIWAQGNTAMVAGDIRIELKTTGELEFIDTATLLGTSGVLALNTHYVVQVRTRRHATTPDTTVDQVQAWIDGAEVMNVANRGVGTWQQFVLGANMVAEAQTQGDWYFSGYIINDDQGTTLNTRPDLALRVTYLKPNGAGQYSETTPNTGANWECVDDTLPDGDTTNAKLITSTSATWANAGNRLMMAFEDAAAGNIGSADTIHAIGAGFIWRGDSASSCRLTPGVRSNGSDIDLSSDMVTSSGLYLVWGGSATSAVWSYVDPSDSNPWTAAKLDAAEFGVRSVDSDPDVLLTAYWVAVVHTEVASAAGGSRLLQLGVGR